MRNVTVIGSVFNTQQDVLKAITKGSDSVLVTINGVFTLSKKEAADLKEIAGTLGWDIFVNREGSIVTASRRVKDLQPESTTKHEIVLWDNPSPSKEEDPLASQPWWKIASTRMAMAIRKFLNADFWSS